MPFMQQSYRKSPLRRKPRSNDRRSQTVHHKNVKHVVLRSAAPADAQQCLDIYRPIVESTTISFEEAVPDVQTFAHRIVSVLGQYPWLLAEHDGTICGFAYGHRHRERPAYRYSVEVSVYVAESERGHGVGRLLYEGLFDDLRARGLHRAFAGIALPNDASIALHERCGFEHIGIFKEIGRKFDRWLDVSWWQRPI